MLKKLKNKLKLADNRGSSFVLVIVSATFLSILVSALLMGTLLAYKLRFYKLNSLNNFYSVEKAMDEIYAGIGAATNEHLYSAYTTTAEIVVYYKDGQYNNLTEDEANDLFKQFFMQGIKSDKTFSNMPTLIDQEIAQVAKDACETYQKYASADETYNYVVEAGSDAGISENEIEAVKSFRNIGDECGEFKDFTGEYKIAETEGNVIVTLYADCTEKEALIKVTFVDNSATYNLQRYQLMNQYGYSEEQADEALSSQGMYPYKSTDVEIAANMTFEDKMKAAGTNTLIDR